MGIRIDGAGAHNYNSLTYKISNNINYKFGTQDEMATFHLIIPVVNLEAEETSETEQSFLQDSVDLDLGVATLGKRTSPFENVFVIHLYIRKVSN